MHALQAIPLGRELLCRHPACAIAWYTRTGVCLQDISYLGGCTIKNLCMQCGIYLLFLQVRPEQSANCLGRITQEKATSI